MASSPPLLSLILPVLEVPPRLAACLAVLGPLAAAVESEIIVVDGAAGGRLSPLHVYVEGMAGRVIAASPGRGGQLAAGAAAARGKWLLFLHGDTVLASRKEAPGPFQMVIADFIGRADNAGRAAVFHFALDDRGRGPARLEKLVAWRTRVLGLPYGDQGLLISRALYQSIGGFRPLPLMEDVDIIRRLGRRRWLCLPVTAVTSAERYRREGYFLRPLRNLFCLTLYFAGLPPRLLRRLYGA